jgi:hypothetical protein
MGRGRISVAFGMRLLPHVSFTAANNRVNNSIDDGLLSCSGDGDYSGAVSNVLSIKSLTEAVSIANAELKAATKPKKRWWKRGGFSV